MCLQSGNTKRTIQCIIFRTKPIFPTFAKENISEAPEKKNPDKQHSVETVTRTKCNDTKQKGGRSENAMW